LKRNGGWWAFGGKKKLNSYPGRRTEGWEKGVVGKKQKKSNKMRRRKRKISRHHPNRLSKPPVQTGGTKRVFDAKVTSNKLK